jgi:hypothetical protein
MNTESFSCGDRVQRRDARVLILRVEQRMKKHFRTIKKHLKRKKHHMGYATSALVFLGLGMMLAQNNDAIPFKQDEAFLPPEDEFEQDFIDPREIENALREISRMKGEIKGLQKRAARFNNQELNRQIAQIMTELDQLGAKIKNPPGDYTMREALQEWYEARMWEELNKARAQVELPQMLKEIPVVVKRVERLLKLKTYQKLGLDTGNLAEYLNEVKEAHAAATIMYKEGNFEEAMEALSLIHESGHPGELAA